MDIKPSSGGGLYSNSEMFTGNGTYTKKANVKFIIVECLGGSGGVSYGAAGGAGGTSSFAGHNSATGGGGIDCAGNGVGANGAGSGGDINSYPGIIPGITANNTAYVNSFGGAGGYSRKKIMNSAIGATVAITVGAGGSSGMGGAYVGRSGWVIVHEYI